MVVSTKQFLSSINNLTITLTQEYFIDDIISIEYQNISYYFQVKYRAISLQDAYIYTLKPTFNTNFQLL